MVLPIGWLPVGVLYAAEGNVVPALMGFLGMTLIGTASLYRAYKKTVDQYRGAATNRKTAPVPTRVAAAKPVSERKPRTLLLEARLPGCSEPVSAVTLAALRSLVRSPEGKMMLLSPLISTLIFGSVLWRTRQSIPPVFRPWVPIGGVTLGFLGLLQIMANQFGFDRDGFRVFVISAIRRRDILLGKNLAFAPLALGVGAAMVVAAQVVCPMRLDHFVAMAPQLVSMYLPFCILGNFLSVYAPVYIAPGSLKASNPKLTTVLVQLVAIMIFFPLFQALTLFPLVAEIGLGVLGWGSNLPIFLLLGLAQCAVVAVIYRFSVNGMGNLLQDREQTILEVVTRRSN